MCGINGLVQHVMVLSRDHMSSYIGYMSKLIEHRGPDDRGEWISDNGKVGLGHLRLSIIDTSSSGHQPMQSDNGLVISYNGEIYNYIELRKELSDFWQFKTNGDTEVILALYSKYGENCVDHLRGMFAFAIWDQKSNKMFCARDRFGIKPFYYLQNKDKFLFASEAKALVPFIDSLDTDKAALSEYMIFQYTIGENSLFSNIKNLLPGHSIVVKNGKLEIKEYWKLVYEPDYRHTEKYFFEKLDFELKESVGLHLRSDVPVGAYLSGGVDSSLISALAKEQQGSIAGLYHGRFLEYKGYDESEYAIAAAKSINSNVNIVDITHKDFADNISKVIYHLDFPVAGPGSFPQFMVSKLASKDLKVVLGGQGGDELFGGYARYLIAYFEQCINAAIEDKHHNGNFVVTPESIIPNLKMLKEYKPLMKQFWKQGLFGELDERYFRLVNRSVDFNQEIDFDSLDIDSVFGKFQQIFNSNNVKKASYFDKMTHFDLKCLLPALLHVEDRMSMACGLESRVPFLDHKLAEFIASIPADVKFKGGRMKHLLKEVFKGYIPEKIYDRRDKMGFPVPLQEWFKGPLKEFVLDIFSSRHNNRGFFCKEEVVKSLSNGDSQFSRKIWGLLSLELWYQNFHDRHSEFKKGLKLTAPMQVKVPKVA